MKNLKKCPRGLIPAIFVMTSGMIFGADWRPINSGLPVTSTGVGVLTIDPKTPSVVYASTVNGSVFKTKDSGGSWAQISTVAAVNSLIVDSKNPSTLYAATGHGVVKSLDGGETWTGANTGLSDIWVYTLVADPKTPSTLYAQTVDGLFKTNDGAETWSPVVVKIYAEATTPLAYAPLFFAKALVIDPKNSSTMYAAVLASVGSGLFKSTDSGSTWYLATNFPGAKVALDFQIIPVFDPVNPSTMYAGYNDFDPVSGPGAQRTAHLVKSTDDGVNWNTIGGGFPANSRLGTLAVDPTTPSAVYATYADENGSGVIKSKDGGQTFNKLDTGLPPYNIGSVVAISPTSPSTVYAGYFDSRRGGIVKSKDGGVSWNAADAGLTRIDVRTLAIDPASTSTVYAGVGGAGEGVFKSLDSGAHWSSLAQFQINGTPFFGEPPQAAEPGAVTSLVIPLAKPSVLYAATARISGGCVITDKLFFKSTDGGVSWGNIDPYAHGGCFFNWSPPVIALDPTDSDDLYLGVTDSGAYLFNSPDGGLNWKTPTGGFADNLNALVIDPTNAAILYASTAEGVFKSTNGGAVWTDIGLSIGVNALAIDRTNPSTLYAATEGSWGNPGFHGMFKSIDGGASWAPINNGLASAIDMRSPVTALAIAPDSATLYAATSGNGVYKSSDGGASWAPFNDGLTNLDVRVLTVSARAPNTLYAATPGGTFTMIDELR